MKKETIVAIVFGLTLGSVVAFFIILNNKNQQLEKSKAISPVAQVSPTITQPEVNSTTLTVSSPEDSQILTKNTVTLKGKGEKGALIVVQSPIKDLSQKLDTEDFSMDFPLSLGDNIIRITLYPKTKDASPQTKDLRVYYMEEQ